MKAQLLASNLIQTISRRRQSKTSIAKPANVVSPNKRPDTASQLSNFGAYLKEMSYRRGLENVSTRIDHHIEQAFDQIRREEQDIIHKLLCLD